MAWGFNNNKHTCVLVVMNEAETRAKIIADRGRVEDGMGGEWIGMMRGVGVYS